MREEDTKIGGGRGQFPQTNLSIVGALRAPDETARARALETLITAYWKPVYKYVRMQWRKSNEDAKDLTQSFFARAMEKNYFDSYDPAKSRFRTFVRTCLDGFLANENKAARAQKRGGELQFLSMDFVTAEMELSGASLRANDTPESYFEREWIRQLFTISLEALRKQLEDGGKSVYYDLLEAYDIDPESDHPPSYKELSEKYGISTTDVTNYLSFARREFRKIVLGELRKLTGSEEEYRREARAILGVKL